MWQVPLADVKMSPQDIRAVVDTYRSGWLSMGPRTEELENAFAKYVGAKHAFAVANGTAALHLACAACGLEPGDRAVAPSMTFVATVNAIAYTGAEPVFADIAGITKPWLAPATVESAIDDKTRAIMVVAYGGHPGSLPDLTEVAKHRQLVLIEDAAHALGTRVNGRHVGTFGTVGAFSLFANKNLPVGEGGMVVTDDDDVAAKVKLLRSHGMTTLTWDRHRGHASSYDVVALGFNYRLDEPRAALALSRLSRLDEANAARASIVERYRVALTDIDGLSLLDPAGPDVVDSSHLFAVVLDPDVDRDAFRRSLAEQGVQTSVHYPPIHHFSIYSHLAASLPVTDDYAARTVTLPLFPHMTRTQFGHVVSSLPRALLAARSQ
jgi:dTDP-4-amino-4,6-dideoxygalactose transaminase